MKGGNNMKIILDVGAYLPTYAHDADAGMDLRTPVAVRPALTFRPLFDLINPTFPTGI